MDRFVINEAMSKGLDFSGYDLKKYQDVIQGNLSNTVCKGKRQNGITTKNLIRKYYPKLNEVPIQDKVYNEKSAKLLIYMHRMFLAQTMCDMLVHADGGSIMTHQSVVAVYSPALSYIFAQNALQKTVSIKMCNVSVEVVADVLNCLYTTDLKLGGSNIEQVILCAKQLDLPLFVEICREYLSKYTNSENLFYHYSLAANYGFEPVKEFLMKTIAQNVLQYKDQLQLLLLPADRLLSLFQHPNFTATPADLLDMVVKWIGHDECRRISCAEDLLVLVDLREIEPAQLASVIDGNEWLLTDEYCREQTLKAFKFHAISNAKGRNVEARKSNDRQKQPMGSIESLSKSRVSFAEKTDMKSGRRENDESRNFILASKSNFEASTSANGEKESYATKSFNQSKPAYVSHTMSGNDAPLKSSKSSLKNSLAKLKESLRTLGSQPSRENSKQEFLTIPSNMTRPHSGSERDSKSNTDHTSFFFPKSVQTSKSTPAGNYSHAAKSTPSNPHTPANHYTPSAKYTPSIKHTLSAVQTTSSKQTPSVLKSSLTPASNETFSGNRGKSVESLKNLTIPSIIVPEMSRNKIKESENTPSDHSEERLAKKSQLGNSQFFNLSQQSLAGRTSLSNISARSIRPERYFDAPIYASTPKKSAESSLKEFPEQAKKKIEFFMPKRISEPQESSEKRRSTEESESHFGSPAEDAKRNARLSFEDENVEAYDTNRKSSSHLSALFQNSSSLTDLSAIALVRGETRHKKNSR